MFNQYGFLGLGLLLLGFCATPKSTSFFLDLQDTEPTEVVWDTKSCPGLALERTRATYAYLGIAAVGNSMTVYYRKDPEGNLTAIFERCGPNKDQKPVLSLSDICVAACAADVDGNAEITELEAFLLAYRSATGSDCLSR